MDDNATLSFPYKMKMSRNIMITVNVGDGLSKKDDISNSAV